VTVTLKEAAVAQQPAAGPTPKAQRPTASPARFTVITGLSGSGKSLALRVFEELGYYCVDNIPPSLLPQLADLTDGGEVDRIACVVDVRAGPHLPELLPALLALKERRIEPELIFLESTDEVLVNRFKETRRKHPLLRREGGILPSLEAERALLIELKARADRVIDTSDYTPRALAVLLGELFGDESPVGLTVSVLSFGFKHGLPLDADLVFDVRFLANPHYVRELRWQDGRSEAVREYVMEDPLTGPLLARLCDLIEFTIPHYIAEGKAYLTIAVGCTGGRHRSVVVAEEIGRFLRSKSYEPLVQHRDAKK
jgi:UPF0042 nucleotide-binding protein